MPDSVADSRRKALDLWVAEYTGQDLVGESASSDASFRRYFRYQFDGRTLIGMDAPPPQEDCRPFVAIDRLLASAGLNVPELLAEDLARGYLLLGDLGRQTYLDVMDSSNADQLFFDAINALIKLQLTPCPDDFPVYDEALLRRELELFPQWYLEQHCGIRLDEQWRSLLDRLFDRIVAQVLGQERVLVHRDYMPRNLMISEPNPGVLDFQDAVYGPISYDPACLFKDAFISWPNADVERWLRQYWQRAREEGLPVPEGFELFQRECAEQGAQRHLKVIGIFARICHRDGKPRYLSDVPRFFAYLRTVAARCEELAPLSELLDRVDTLKNETVA